MRSPEDFLDRLACRVWFGDVEEITESGLKTFIEENDEFIKEACRNDARLLAKDVLLEVDRFIKNKFENHDYFGKPFINYERHRSECSACRNTFDVRKSLKEYFTQILGIDYEIQ